MGVWAAGSEMRLFLNDRYQFTVRRPGSFTAGRLAFSFMPAGQTPVTVSFSDLAVYSVSYISPTPSLTPRTPSTNISHLRSHDDMKNKLNDLDPKTWLKFQKSWFIHNPPPRKKGVLVHPAKFPETMAQEFIEFFTKRGETVLDPMAGTGSTLIAALRAGRNSYGIELNPKYAEIARQLIAEERKSLGCQKPRVRCRKSEIGNDYRRR